MTEEGNKAVDTILTLDPVIRQCPSCGIRIDVMGYCGIIRCSSCDYKFYVEGIEPQPYALPSVESAIDFFNSVITDTRDQTVGRTGILGFPLGPLRRLGFLGLGLTDTLRRSLDRSMEKGRKGPRGRIRGLSPGLITLITLIQIDLIHGSMTITRSTDPLIEETS